MLHLSSFAASHPVVANSSSMGAAGWSRAGPHGATRPTKAFMYLLWFDERSCSCEAVGVESVEVLQGVFVGVVCRSWHLGGHVWEGVAGCSGIDCGGCLVCCVVKLELCGWAGGCDTNGCVRQGFLLSLTCGSV